MKNKAVNGLVAIILGVVFSVTEIYISIGLTIYGLWLASKVLEEKDDKKKIDRVLAIIVYVIGLPLIAFIFYSFFVQII